jgi:hypothetical protein
MMDRFPKGISWNTLVQPLTGQAGEVAPNPAIFTR